MLAELFLFVVDMIRKSSFNDPRKRRAKGIRNTDVFVSKRAEFTQKLMEAWHDNRLMSRKSERHDKWGIAIDPSPMAMTWKRLYAVLMLAGAGIGCVGHAVQQPALTAVGVLVGMSWCMVAVRQGKAKMDAEQNIYDTVFSVLKGHFGTSDPNARPRDIIHIDQWTTPEEPQLIADGRTKSSEDGEAEEFEKDVPKPDKKGRVRQPRIAEFRTTPLSMKVDFPPTFREAGTDDTLQHLNEAFGHVTEWVAERDVPDEKHPGRMKTISGWDFPGHTAYLRTVPPLPTMAKLPVDFDKGPWNQIKLGRTVSGEAYWDLKVTPMALVPLAVDTPVWKRTGVGEYEPVRLDSLKAGDVLLTEMGTDTEVLGTTPEHIPDAMFRIVFVDDMHEHRRLHTVKAAADHVWLMEDGSEATSQRIYDETRMGNAQVLAPVYGDGRMIRWRVYSIAYMTPEPVMCVKVDDGMTHTFLIAARKPVECGADNADMDMPMHADDADGAVDAGMSAEPATMPEAEAVSDDDGSDAGTGGSDDADMHAMPATSSEADGGTEDDARGTALTAVEIGCGYSEIIASGTADADVLPEAGDGMPDTGDARNVRRMTAYGFAADRDGACADGIPTHNCGSTGGGKSVLQRLAVFHCIAHSADIKFLGIDLKMVELSPYTVFSDTVLGIAITLEDAVEILRFGKEQMMKRYNQMQKAGVNNFADLPNHGPAILIMVDECGQLLDMSGGKGTEEAKAESDLKGQAQSIIGSIARLGRAAGVHLLLATQRPDAKLIPGELKENLMFRAGCGHLTSTASSMLFDDATGTQTPASPKGRAAVMNVGQKPQKIQVYFTKDYSWMEDWLRKKGLNPDLTPLSTGPTIGGAADVSNLQNMTLDDNGADIDAIAAQRDAIAHAHAQAVQEQSNAMQGADMRTEPDVSDFTKPVLKGQQAERHDPRDDWDDDMEELVD